MSSAPAPMKRLSLRFAVALLLAAGAAMPAVAGAQVSQPGSAAPTARPTPQRKPAPTPPRREAAPKRDAAKTAATRPPKAARQPKAVPEPPPAPPEDAGPEQLQAAELVYYGTHDCDDKQVIDVERDGRFPGYVTVKLKTQSWTMKPVASQTGAVRLEDVQGQTLLVQIPFKSMLMNVKTGQRMVDSCMHEVQKAASQEAARSGPSSDGGILSK